MSQLITIHSLYLWIYDSHVAQCSGQDTHRMGLVVRGPAELKSKTTE